MRNFLSEWLLNGEHSENAVLNSKTVMRRDYTEPT